MADLVDTSAAWETGVYQIETTDPVLGGVPNPSTGAGMSNIPHLQLARRTQFLRGQLGGFGGNVAYSVNGAIPAANIGLRGVWSAGTTGALTLPAVTSVPIGASFYVAAGGAAVTISPNGSDEVFATDGASVGPVVLARGDDVRITGTGAAWSITGGSYALLRSGSLAFGNYRFADTVGAGFTLTSADAGELFVYGGTTAITITLPALASVAPGGVFEFVNTGTADVTVQRAGSDQIDSGPTSVNSIAIPPNQSLRLVRANASSLWHPIGLTALAQRPMGEGQTWQSVSRVANTSYQNTTGRSIQVSLRSSSNGATVEVSANGTTWFTLITCLGAESDPTFVLPPGHFYRFSTGWSQFAELR